MEYSNPDPGLVARANAPAVTPSTATRGGDAATQIGTANAKIAGVTSGTTPERLGGDAVAIRQRVSAIADAATKAPLIRAEIARAFATFNSVAPTPEQLAAAEKAVTDTAAVSTAANTKADAPGASKEDQDAADAAGKAAADAKTKLAELRQKRKAARDTLFEALRAAAKKVKEITGGREKKDAPGGGRGYGTGATGTTGSGTPAGKPTTTGSGTPAATPGAKAPGTTPGSTPAAATPKTTTAGTTGVDPDTATLAAALTKGQQNQQMPTMPTVPQQSAQPAAAAQQPQAQQQPKQGKESEKHGLNTDGILSTDDIARAIGENTGPMLTTAYTSGASSPINAGPTTQYRPAGTPIQGTTPGGTSVQASPTTGTSRTDLVTTQGNAEVGGRPQGTENRAFSATPDGSAQTKLSAGDPANQSAAQQGRPGTGGGMPMSPMMAAPGALSSPPPSNPKADGDKDKILQRNGYHGEDTIAEAVPGGTIAQNRPSRRDAA
ncbi:Uncharacterised protein [Mycobacteroides abscessus]|uniref:hypothetical protein n=1 Tax=Mycobacteroides abscessus TaxID=36809 RepID=UPI0005E3D886|nr:hypothetical protein [Mycobacteroides abscessus]CPS10764.1 Uncharacterised protein [Mycobacteroides abscessus]CPS50435.1 Uncharacterised protein [Mycobacteroides abscessus]CPS93781.1 Uncharacterised protein [Mycobacteroides abscessus]CPS94209.1 Uncharacterised protein [Mycobacteroides abscessus]CPT61828.1 Uncharacterised protein [Mycobacteroides abscessus]